ncbi:hypothetical protein QYE76_034263 [Lolium multiflorum]|uniref:F-box domain-containing protein n=1 Tax=Lolium multiflorum TaxID=4521 RepID=A0AAD8QWR9_LOLMU|nr:hypothetical protein QYE76_034263 [Lolium multiflorum]
MGHSRPRWKNAQRKSGQEDKGDAIPDELLGLVFLRLTSPLDLVRAAFACRSWRKVIAAEDFRVLSARHGAPSSIVAGHYHISFSHCHYRPSGLLPHFVPSSSSCWAGVAANNLALDFLPRAPNGDLSLELADSRGGLLLLADFDHTEHGKPFEQPSRLVVCDPLAGQYVTVPPPPAVSHTTFFRNVSDRDRLISSSPNQFGDVNISFVKHDEGINWRGVTFNRDVWLLLVGPPLDHMKTEDLNACFSDIGSLLLWERDPNRKGRVLVKVRVTDLQDIPRSIRMTESSRPDAESWTFLVEVLQHNLLGGGPPDEDPLPDEGVDPHPMPGHALPAPLFPPPQPNVQNNEDAADGWGHWAMGPVQEQPQPMDIEAQEHINNFMPEVQEEVDMGEEQPLA